MRQVCNIHFYDNVQRILSIFFIEVLIRGTRIRFMDGASSLREICGFEQFKTYITSMVCKQITKALYYDALSMGVKKANIANDHMSLKIPLPGEWNGNFVGEGKVPDDLVLGSMYVVVSTIPKNVRSI